MEVPAPAVPAPAAPPPAAAPAPRRPPGPRRTRWLFRAVVLTHTAAACAQPLLAGSYFAGDVDAIAAHGVVGTVLPPLCLLQLLAAVLLLRPGRGPWLPVAATVLLFLAEGLQLGTGYARLLAVHVPLGVGVVAALVALSLWSLLGLRSPARVAARAGRGAP